MTRNRPPRGPWQIAGLVLSVVLAVGGLVVVAGAIIFMVGLNSWASNK